MNPHKMAYPLAVFTLATFLAAGCGSEAQAPVQAPSAVSMRYADFMLDQPNMPTLAEFKKLLSPNSPQKSWAWDGGNYTVEHGPDHKLIVTASLQCQEVVANSLLHLTMENSSKFPKRELPLLGAADPAEQGK